LFCAQCGNALVTQTITPSFTPAEQNAGGAEQDLEGKTKAEPEVFGAEETEGHPIPGLRANQSVPAPDDSKPGVVSATNHYAPPAVTGGPRHGSSHDPRKPGQERRSAARVAMEARVKPGVDKLRRVSSVVLNEAAFDPGVRFILVVGVLFLLFLVLLLLSKWIG
jgi:hypothetical protein